MGIPMVKSVFCLLVVVITGVPAAGQQGRAAAVDRPSELLRKARPSVFIEYDRVATVAPLYEGESGARIWLRMTNNSRWSIEFCSFGVEHPYGDLGLVYEVKQVAAGMREGGGGPGVGGETMPSDVSDSGVKDVPVGYSTGCACSMYQLKPGRSVLFSVPREHVAERLYVAVEYWPEWENRDNELGTYPSSFVTFSHSSLPASAR